jgi:mediator of RNA polymerase II transcription subunit 31
MELEFVLCLALPDYLVYLADRYPHLLVPSEIAASSADPENTEAARFARYLAYLHNYWQTPQYAQYLTHPGTVLRNLQLLQQEQFKKDLVNVNTRGFVASRLAMTDPLPNETPNGDIMAGETAPVAA